MKIAFFTDNYLPQASGIATSVYYFVHKLNQMGIKVYVFAPKIRGFKDKQDNIYRLPSVSLFPALPDGLKLPLPIPDKSFWKIKKLDFDLIHIHGNGPFSILGLTIAKLKKVPIIQTFHTNVESFNGYFLKGKVVRPALVNNIFLKKMGNLCDGVIAPSKKMSDQLIKAGVTRKIEIIPNFVELGFLNNTSPRSLRKLCKIPKTCPIILSAGRLGREKNFEFLVKVFGKVAKMNRKVALVIVGPDWGEVDKLRQLAKNLSVEQRVYFPGRINPILMPNVYKDSDIFVFTSTSETQGMCILEAAACGLPIIVNRDSAYKNMVVNNKNGFILPMNEDIFAKKINKLLDNPQIIKKFAKNSPDIIKKRFNGENLTRKLINFYHQIIEETKIQDY